MIEERFDRIDGVKAIIRASDSLGSKRRMNQNRTVAAISSMPCLAYGRRYNLVFRQYDNGHNLPLECDGSEAKSRIEEQQDSHYMKEGFIKLPRMLKDMLDVLQKKAKYDERTTEICTVGLLHSGLSCTMIKLNHHTSYISRVLRDQTVEISNKSEQFGATVLPALLSSWVRCKSMKEVRNVVVSTPTNDTDGSICLCCAATWTSYCN